MESLETILHDRVHNQKWFTARGLVVMSRVTGRTPQTNAKIVALMILYFLIGQNAWVVCNSILVIVPLLLTFTFPSERPQADTMHVYWIIAFIVSAYDRMLETFPLYYTGKLCILLSLLIDSSALSEQLKILFKMPVKSEKSSMDEKVRGKSESTAWDQSHGSSRLESSRADTPISSARSPLTAIGHVSDGMESKSSTLGAPTPYDAVPFVNTKASSRDIVRVTKESKLTKQRDHEYVPSTYIGLPKPVDKHHVTSIRVRADGKSKPRTPKNQRKTSTSKLTADNKNSSDDDDYFALPKSKNS
ncbi:hypothetical protein DICVIV_09078 [Dictyocaulus viviparus]|uniref:Uncharacterized protein n=1 Tax=Dictyocaulus viviparus TaxID=29172 RepID=A0A0D8XR84_DICVI|nr:hypothetical protein DICVIV_09078 [Dictyocaulus viviparus]